MQNADDFPKSLGLLVGAEVVIYLSESSPCLPASLPPFPREFMALTIDDHRRVGFTVVGGVIYRNLGQYTTSPSLNSLSPTMAKVAYGIGLPTIIIAGCESGACSPRSNS